MMKQGEEMKMTDWQNLTKKERRQLKKEHERQEREMRVRKGRLIKWGFILGIIVLLVGVVSLFKYLNDKRFVDSPKIQINPINYDFGKVPLAKGKVETNFEIKNVGVSPLVLSGMETSCDCTSAKLRIGEKESPLFGMHSNPIDWSGSLNPGETAQLVVIYDAKVHPVQGPVTRAIWVFSNDPQKPKDQVIIQADVQP